MMEDNLDDMKLCANCKHENINLDDEPCLLCVPLGDRKYWKPKVTEFEMEKKCTNCKNSSLGIYEEPCKSCCGEPNTLNSELPSLWEPKLDTSGSVCAPSGVIKPKKKSKWHLYPDEKPKAGRELIVWDNDPNPRNMKMMWNVEFFQNETGEFIRFGTKLLFVTHFRYMPKPPKEYRK